MAVSGIILFTGQIAGQPEAMNDHVRYDVRTDGESFIIEYRYLGPFGDLRDCELRLPVAQTMEMTGKFGIPVWLFEPYRDNEENRRMREEVIRRGLFTLHNNIIEVDKQAVLATYGETFCRPIASMIAASLSEAGTDTRRNRIEHAMCFVQDIPYGIPPRDDGVTHFGGVFVPPALLINGYGDCDSKAILFAGILAYLIPAGDILFLNQEDHVLTAVRGEPENGMTLVNYQGGTYLLAETAGPGKRSLGEKGNYFRDKFLVESLTITPPQVIPQGNQSNPFPTARESDRLEDNVLLVRNESGQRFLFHISPDNRRWERLSLEAHQNGRYRFEKRTQVYLRVRDKKDRPFAIRLETGGILAVRWNDWKKEWEFYRVSQGGD